MNKLDSSYYFEWFSNNKTFLQAKSVSFLFGEITANMRNFWRMENKMEIIESYEMTMELMLFDKRAINCYLPSTYTKGLSY